MRNAAVILLMLILTMPIDSIAQKKGTLRGYITDEETGEVLAFSNALIKELNIGASTDANGYFIITAIPPGKTYTVKFSYVGYESKEMKVLVGAGKVTHIDVKLKPSSYELQTVEKVGKKVQEENATDIGLQRLTIKELQALPKGVETDVFRSLQYLPGVRSTGDVSAKYYVRGGSSDQNLVLLNGITIYNPFHSLGMFSVIDPEIINSVEFYKGGFTADYGGRLSSVLNVISKDGNKNNYSSSISASYLTGKALIEGPIPHGSFMISARKTYSNEIIKKFMNDQNIPIDFYDFSYKLNYSNPNFYEGSKFIINGFSSGDKLENDDPNEEDYEWKNNAFGFTWFQVGKDSPLFFDINFNYSDFEGKLIPNKSEKRPKFNELKDISLNANFNYVYESKDELGIGLAIKDIETKLFLVNSYGVESDVGGAGTSISLFAKYKFLRWDNFGLDIGSRFNLTHMAKSGGKSLEPRVSITYTFIPQISIKAAWGVYTQELFTLSNEDEVVNIFEPWMITPDYINASSAEHFIAGIQTQFHENFSLDLETYYKKIDNLPALNDEKTFISDPDVLAGEGESYGWEALIRYNNDPVNLTASYANAWAYKEVKDWLYYPRYDARHTVNLGFDLNIGKGWKTSLMWVYSSGIPFTKFIGYYDKFYIDNPYLENHYYENYRPYTILDDKNLGRLPDYHRMDFNVSKKIDLSYLFLELNFSIINIYDRKNIFYFERETGERINMLPFLPTATIKMEF